MQGRRSDKDLTGRTFGELTVIENGPRIKNKPTWRCKCSCGKECFSITNDLLSGKKKSCGHLRGHSKELNLTNQVFSELTVLRKVANKRNKTYWRCVCSCGKECDVQTSDLTMGNRKDCGHSHEQYMHQTRTSNIVGKR